MDVDNWRECVRERFPELNPHAWPGSCTLDGKQLLEDFPVAQLCDRTVRLRQYPLPGGMPPPDFASMRKATLMEEAKRPGVPTRKDVIQPYPCRWPQVQRPRLPEHLDPRDAFPAWRGLGYQRSVPRLCQEHLIERTLCKGQRSWTRSERFTGFPCRQRVPRFPAAAVVRLRNEAVP